MGLKEGLRAGLKAFSYVGEGMPEYWQRKEQADADRKEKLRFTVAGLLAKAAGGMPEDDPRRQEMAKWLDANGFGGIVSGGNMPPQNLEQYGGGPPQNAAPMDVLIPYEDKSKEQQRSGYYSTRVMYDAATKKSYEVPFNHRTGKFEWDKQMPVDEQGRVLVSGKSPEAQAAVEGAKTSAKEEAKARTQAKIDLPSVKSNADYMKKKIDELLAHPGFESTVGAPGWGKVSRYVSGTKEADFMTRHKQITGKTFMKAYETLKGGGQITEIEGQKATEALQRMTTAASEKEYRAAAEDFKREIDRLTALAEQRASGKEPSPAKSSNGWSAERL